jgi:hypothetical protein
MSYYLEVWLRGLKQHLSPEADDTYHPHITLVRPFSPKVDERSIQEKIIEICHGLSPIPFTLEGWGKFDNIQYIPVNSEGLLQLNDLMEHELNPYVEFVEKLNPEKILHIAIQVSDPEPFPRQNLHMVRLTCIRNKKIWFSYDFVTQKVLNREESLDEKRWQQTIDLFKA